METPADAVLVGYDGSADSQRALAWSAGAAQRHKRALHIVVAHGDGRKREEVATGLREKARDQAASYGLQRVTAATIRGEAAPVLLTAADRASMVVLGARGHSMLGGALVGSVSQHVTQHAPCTVVVARAPHDPQTNRIVVGVDGSVGSDHALAFAFAEADRAHAPLTAVYAWNLLPGIVGSTAGFMPLTMHDEAGAAERLLSEAVAGWVRKHPEVEFSPAITPLHPSRALADASDRAALVVVGSHGRGAFSRLLLGSVGQSLLHQARCPVAIAR